MTKKPFLLTKICNSEKYGIPKFSSPTDFNLFLVHEKNHNIYLVPEKNHNIYLVPEKNQNIYLVPEKIIIYL